MNNQTFGCFFIISLWQYTTNIEKEKFMTLYEELYYQLSNLPKYYRYEGLNSYQHFSFNTGELLENKENYIYFSINDKHHFYYVSKRLKQLVDEKFLYETKYSITRKTIINSEKFQEIIQKIESEPLEDVPVSIEFCTSFLMKKLLMNNYVRNTKKSHGDYRIERVDVSQRGGGYGFYGEWLEVFQILTLIYSYQEITKEDLIQYVYNYRERIINPNFQISPVSFLNNPNKRIIVLNESLQNNFSKYKLMNAIQNILEKKLYLCDSYLGKQGEEGAKKIIQEYSQEREKILALLEENYKRRLIMK